MLAQRERARNLYFKCRSFDGADPARMADRNLNKISTE